MLEKKTRTVTLDDNYGQVLRALRRIIKDDELEVDFIFLCRRERYEYHSKQKVFVIETRLFDTVEFDPDQDQV